MIDLSHDPRWLRLTDPGFRIPGFAGGVFDLDIDRPAAWSGGDPVRGDDPFDPRNFLSEDFCVIGDARFFLHGVVEAPIVGGGGRTLAFGCWAEVSREGFDAYVRSLDGSEPAPRKMAASFASQIPGFGGTLGQPCALRPKSGPERPAIALSDPAHPLAEVCRRGLTLDALLDVYARAGVDLRAALQRTH